MVKPLRGKTTTLGVLLTIYGFFVIAMAAVDIWEYYTYINLPPDAAYGDEFLPVDIAVLATAVIAIVLYIMLAITFLTWISRTNRNLRALSDIPMKYTPGWAIGWYFVPFANLIMPYYVMREIWRVAHGDSTQDSKTYLVDAWWLFWILSNFVGRFVFRSSLNIESVSDNVRVTLISAGSAFLDLTLTIVALIMVNTIYDAYEKNYDETQPALPAEPEAMQA